jgi:hypothetical protein
MKFFWTTIFCCFGCLNLVKINAQSNLVVFSPMGQHFYLSVDNKLQYSKPVKNLKVTGMAEGNCFVTVDFWNKDIPDLKQSIRIENGKEISFIIKKDGNRMVLEEYSNVPFAQVNNVDPKQRIVNYNRNGVERVEVAEVENEPNIFIERGKQQAATLAGPSKGQYDNKRDGKFSIKEESNSSDNENTNSNQPDLSKYPQTTEKISYKTETRNNGTLRVVEVKEITIKDVVERNGQKYISTKTEMRENVTTYSCVPMLEEDFQTAMSYIQRAAASPYSNALNQFKEACLTPKQAEEVAKLIGEDRLDDFVAEAQPKCADEKKCPWGMKEEPIAQNDVKEEPKEVEEPKEEPKEEPIAENKVEEPKEEPAKPKTAKELKAEMKAAKKREKLAKKEAKRKAKEAKKAAKEAAKAAKKAAKEAAKKK